jgi:PHD/YefM family antitoxin component YafN of YafNO toxin-antitoxin module
MSKHAELMPATELAEDMEAVLHGLKTSNQPLFITEDGRPSAVMLSVTAYERAERERQILLLLARGEREIARSQGHDLDDVLAEADAILANAPL